MSATTTRSTAPPGYTSKNDAIIDLIRFGFGIWSPAQMAVLLFHAERSTWYGKDADQHSQAQAIGGIYSKRAERWVRGPAGVSRATWNRANKELAVDRGPLQRTRRTHSHTGDAPTEYSIDWLTIRAKIAEFQAHKPTAAEIPLLQQDSGGGVSHSETGGAQNATPGCLTTRRRGVSQ